MDCVLEPLDHTFPVVDDEVKMTLPPAQKLKGPLVVMLGVGGIGFTVTTVPVEFPDVQPAAVAFTV